MGAAWLLVALAVSAEHGFANASIQAEVRGSAPLQNGAASQPLVELSVRPNLDLGLVSGALTIRTYNDGIQTAVIDLQNNTTSGNNQSGAVILENFMQMLHQLATTLLCQWRDRDANDLSVVLRIKAHI